MVWIGEEKKDRSDGSRDVRVDSTTSRDVRVGVSLAALIRGQTDAEPLHSVPHSTML